MIMSSRYSGTAWRLHAGGLGNELNHGVHNRHRGKTFAHVPRCPSISFPVKSVSSVSGVVHADALGTRLQGQTFGSSFLVINEGFLNTSKVYSPEKRTL